LLKAKEVLDPLFKQASEDAKNQLLVNPSSVPGFALQTGLGHRKWDNESVTEAWAKSIGLKIDEYKPRELLSPPNMERVIKAHQLTVELPSTSQPSTAPKVIALKEGASQNPFDALVSTTVATNAAVATGSVNTEPPASATDSMNLFAGLLK
jgi:hypothetical protein